MYNPYDWEIRKKKDIGMKMSVVPGSMTKECVLNELTRVSVERDLMNLEISKILEEIKVLKANIEAHEEILEEKLVEMHELDERLIEISRNLPVFEK